MALTQLIDRAHAHGIKVFGATLTPYVGAKYQSAEGEKVREAENDFILHSGKFDGTIDFAKVTADPADPTRFAASAGSVDNLHPGDSGYQIMGDSIDLKLFTVNVDKRPCSRESRAFCFRCRRNYFSS